MQDMDSDGRKCIFSLVTSSLSLIFYSYSWV